MPAMWRCERSDRGDVVDRGIGGDAGDRGVGGDAGDLRRVRVCSTRRTLAHGLLPLLLPLLLQLRQEGRGAADGQEDHEGVHAHRLGELQEKLPEVPPRHPAGRRGAPLAGRPEEPVGVGLLQARLQHRVRLDGVDDLLPAREAHVALVAGHLLEGHVHRLQDLLPTQVDREVLRPAGVLHQGPQLGIPGEDLQAAVLPEDLPGDAAEPQARVGRQDRGDLEEQLRRLLDLEPGAPGEDRLHGVRDLLLGEHLGAVRRQQRRQQRGGEVPQRHRRGADGLAEVPQGVPLGELPEGQPRRARRGEGAGAGPGPRAGPGPGLGRRRSRGREELGRGDRPAQLPRKTAGAGGGGPRGRVAARPLVARRVGQRGVPLEPRGRARHLQLRRGPRHRLRDRLRRGSPAPPRGGLEVLAELRARRQAGRSAGRRGGPAEARLADAQPTPDPVHRGVGEALRGRRGGPGRLPGLRRTGVLLELRAPEADQRARARRRRGRGARPLARRGRLRDQGEHPRDEHRAPRPRGVALELQGRHQLQRHGHHRGFARFRGS
mmetsp:Transcript_76876/g.166364  ORF Transcript_76876/g.166364 Transcript_76876/m.166364 type:complete len:547 (+) Transcript_76876:730-2370(+)